MYASRAARTDDGHVWSGSGSGVASAWIWSGEAVVVLIITCAMVINEITASFQTLRGRTVGKEVNAPTIFIRVAQFDVV